jgi:glutamyl/glutaminyl-tRNA synthetase
MAAIISRFAPAPTGFLHLGHVVNAVRVWGETRARARSTGSGHGRVLLRIEDHDRQRSRPEFEAAILDDLAWLGLEPDEPLVRQSERGAIYEHALSGLRARGLVYACGCARADVTRASAERRPAADVGRRPAADVGRRPASDVGRPFQGRHPGEPDRLRQGYGGPLKRSAKAERLALDWDDAAANDEPRYPGTCRDRGLRQGPGLGLRVRFEPTVERFVDLAHGPQEQKPSEQCGDLLVRDRDGNWTYQFAATVDDYVQGVTLVVRGDDLLASTGRQIQLARLLGRAESPAFLHHALIMKTPLQKLSKSDGDTGIRELRARGLTPAQVIEHAMSLIAG